MGQVIQIDEGQIRDHLGEMVRGTVEETLNAMLDAEADRSVAPAGTSGARLGRTPERPVRSDAADQRRRSNSQDTEAAAPDL